MLIRGGWGSRGGERGGEDVNVWWKMWKLVKGCEKLPSFRQSWSAIYGSKKRDPDEIWLPEIGVFQITQLHWAPEKALFPWKRKSKSLGHLAYYSPASWAATVTYSLQMFLNIDHISLPTNEQKRPHNGWSTHNWTAGLTSASTWFPLTRIERCARCAWCLEMRISMNKQWKYLLA